MSAMLYKSLLVLGIVAMLAVMIFAESGPTEPFQPVIPVFANEIDERTAHHLPFVADAALSPDVVVNPANVPSCDATDQDPFFGCLNTKDENRSYVFDNSTSDNSFNMTYDHIPATGTLPIISAIIEIQCFAPNETPNRFFIDIEDRNGALLYFSPNPLTCPFTNEWEEVSLVISAGATQPTVADFTGGSILFTGFEDSVIYVSFISVVYIVGGHQECSPGDTLAYIGCLWETFINGILRFGRLIINVFVYAGSWFVAIGQYIVNYLAVIVWLYAIPGVPAEIQIALDAYFTVLFGVIAIEIFKLVKPFG